MLFLLNDVVLSVDGIRLPPKLTPRRLQALSFYDLIRLGQELYAEAPLLHRRHPFRARRLAALIVAKAPTINGALFVVPAHGCAIEAVSARFARIDSPLLAELAREQMADALDLPGADRRVWRRLAS